MNRYRLGNESWFTRLKVQSFGRCPIVEKSKIVLLVEEVGATEAPLSAMPWTSVRMFVPPSTMIPCEHAWCRLTPNAVSCMLVTSAVQDSVGSLNFSTMVSRSDGLCRLIQCRVSILQAVRRAFIIYVTAVS